MYRDELVGWLHSFEKHGHENDREFYLESWSGKGDYDVDRIGRGSLFVPALCLSIFGSIQPGPLSKYIRDTVRGGSGDNGLIQRFHAMVCPEPKTTWELVEGISISELEEPVQKIFDHLDRLEFDQDENPVILSFTLKLKHTLINGNRLLKTKFDQASFLPTWKHIYLNTKSFSLVFV